MVNAALQAFGVLLVAVFGAFYQLRLGAVLSDAGLWRSVQPVGNRQCGQVPELQACEKAVLHQETGLLYLACSTPESRMQWLPYDGRYNASGRSMDDYIAFFDPSTNEITRLQMVNFDLKDHPRGLNVHGMDVVQSEIEPALLWVYLVNHRPPVNESDAPNVGADTVIEIFWTQSGHPLLTYFGTAEDPKVMISPNDIVGSNDGKSFWFTNDHDRKIRDWTDYADIYLKRKSTSIGYCNHSSGCKFATTGLHASNGIARGDEDTFYVADGVNGEISVLERQGDDTLVVTDVIKHDRGTDNLSVDKNGAIWAAGFPSGLKMLKHLKDYREVSPSSATRITLNKGESSFYGEKYTVTKMFEDDGKWASGSTTAVHDAQRGILYMTGVASTALTVCNARV